MGHTDDSHGISMGGIMSMDAELWGAAPWGGGEWGDQNNLTLSVTGQTINLSEASVSASSN